MYDHPYEHDQKCFSGWLDYTEPISFNALPRSGPLPRWDTLDATRRFVTAAVVEGNGWMAESPEDIVMFHFLHGDSDKGADLDLSGTWLKDSSLYANMIASATDSGNDSGTVDAATNITLMEIFYGNHSTHEGRIIGLNRSRQAQRVPLLEGMTCGVISYPLDNLRGSTITEVPKPAKKVRLNN